jgi:hypothetical protein
MKQRLGSGKRRTQQLSESVHKRLNAYALAASAAGVGMLALVQSAEAKIVYTPSHHVIGTLGRYNLDLNHDGTTDFVLLQSGNTTGSRCSNTLFAREEPSNAVEGEIVRYDRHFASALTRGARIGPGAGFIKGGAKGETMVASWHQDLSSGPSGRWADVTNRYLGLKFKIDSRTHYGWARLTVKVNYCRINAKLTGYAYETIPGKSIKAGQTGGMVNEWDEEDFGPDASLTNPIPDFPQTATLGTLAMGAPGLAIWRREESVGAPQ